MSVIKKVTPKRKTAVRTAPVISNDVTPGVTVASSNQTGIPPTYYVIHTMPGGTQSYVETVPVELDEPEAEPEVAVIAERVRKTRTPRKPRITKTRGRKRSVTPRAPKSASKPFTQLGTRQKQRVKKEFDAMLLNFCERHKIVDKSEICDKYCPAKAPQKLSAHDTLQLQSKLKFSGKTMNRLRSILNAHGCNVFASKRAVKIIEDHHSQDTMLLQKVVDDYDEHIEVEEDISGELEVDIEDDVEIDETPELQYEDDEQEYEEVEYANTSEEYIETPADYEEITQ